MMLTMRPESSKKPFDITGGKGKVSSTPNAIPTGTIGKRTKPATPILMLTRGNI